jgi:hypothetical protein
VQSEEESNEIKRKLTRHICERHAEGEGCIAVPSGIGLWAAGVGQGGGGGGAD